MRWALAAVVLLLVGCTAPASQDVGNPDVWIDEVSKVNGSEFTYRIVECSDSRLFGGAFIPFEMSIAGREVQVDDLDFESVNGTCVVFEYTIPSEFHEDLLGAGSFSVSIDPSDTINESDERNNVVEYVPESVCIDADGDNPFLSSFVTAKVGTDSIYVLDSCSNATAIEYLCDGNGFVEPMRYNCTDGCVSGSCRCLNSGTCLIDGSATRI